MAPQAGLGPRILPLVGAAYYSSYGVYQTFIKQAGTLRDSCDGIWMVRGSR